MGRIQYNVLERIRYVTKFHAQLISSYNHENTILKLCEILNRFDLSQVKQDRISNNRNKFTLDLPNG